MSNINSELELPCSVSKGCGAVKTVLTPKDKDLGGFCVRRAIPSSECKSIGPWVFFDHMGPATFESGEGIDVRPHPHIGLATVTYLFEGEMLHRDSLGTEARVLPGDINLMVAGKGIVHSERQRPEVKASGNTVNGLQLWLALPKALEQTKPAFYHYAQQELPLLDSNGVAVRVMIGSAYGKTSPVIMHTPTLYIEARMKAGQALTLPNANERGLYVIEGGVLLKDTEISAHSMAVLDDIPGVEVLATHDSVIALVGGDPIGTRYMEWNFVASEQSLIEDAKRKWQEGCFPQVPGDDLDFIPLPE